MSGFEDDFDDDETWQEIEPEDVQRWILDKQAEIKRKILEPREYELKQTKKRICIVDTETDPFEYGVIVKPFTLGFYDGHTYVDFWGDDCVQQFFDYLDTIDYEPLIYAHNGGKFDFHFFLPWLDHGKKPLIMGSRLVKIFFAGKEFRDSFAIIPQALSSYKKDEIDYSNFTRDKREKHKASILAYQKSDCIYSYDLIAGFHEMFGDRITIASAALPMLHSFHGFARVQGEYQDEQFRQYYYGGRNQCFETGLLRPRRSDSWKVYDRNSMYPAVMKDERHPIGADFILQSDIDDDTDFACIDAINKGALPVRAENGSLDFTCERGTFYATIHEIKAGLETGTLKINRVKHAWKCENKTTFGDFVDHFYSLRQVAKANEDEVRNILYKLILNSSYGKFALNPRKFKEWHFSLGDVPQPLASPKNPDGWTLDAQSGDIFIWSRPSPRKKGFINVATAASITGAARADLLRNICNASRPVYCDTDSIICENFSGSLDDHKLGGWKLEAKGTLCAIAGKKLYTLIDEKSPEWMEDKQALKLASKGVRLEAEQILRICKGEEIEHHNPVPTFALGKEPKFISRIIRKTGD